MEKSLFPFSQVRILLTSDWELRAAGCELEEVTTLRWTQFAHCLKQVLDSLAVHIEAMVGLDRVHKS